MLTRTRDDFLRLWRRALAFHLLMQLLGVAFFTPLISGIANHLVAATGEHVPTLAEVIAASAVAQL